MQISAINSALSEAGISHNRVRKHGDNEFRMTGVVDAANASAVLHKLEGVVNVDIDGDKLTVTCNAEEAPAAEAPTTEAPAVQLSAAEAQLALSGNAGSRAKNPSYPEVFDLALAALKSGDTLKEWKAGRRVRMMQTIRKLYADKFETLGRNVVFTGDVDTISKDEVLANLGLKTNRSLPAAAATA